MPNISKKSLTLFIFFTFGYFIYFVINFGQLKYVGCFAFRTMDSYCNEKNGFLITLYVFTALLVILTNNIDKLTNLFSYLVFPVAIPILSIILSSLLFYRDPITLNSFSYIMIDSYLTYKVWELTIIILAAIILQNIYSLMSVHVSIQSFGQHTENGYQTIFWVLLLSFLGFCFLFGFPLLGSVMARKVLALTNCSAAFDYVPECFNDGFIQSRFGPLASFIGALMTPIIFLRQFMDVLGIWSFFTMLFGWLAFKDKLQG